MNKNFTLGFEWNENMSYDDFLTRNESLKRDSRSWEIFNLIEERYIQMRYENK